MLQRKIDVVPNHYPKQGLFQYLVKITNFRSKAEIKTDILPDEKEVFEQAMRIKAAFY